MAACKSFMGSSFSSILKDYATQIYICEFYGFRLLLKDNGLYAKSHVTLMFSQIFGIQLSRWIGAIGVYHSEAFEKPKE